MESSVQSTSQVPEDSFRAPDGQTTVCRLSEVHHEMDYLNKIGKCFVAAIDRFQVHHALLAALQELYSFSACCVLLKGDPFELIIIPCYPLNPLFLESMIQRITNAANALNFPPVTPEQLTRSAYFDAPDELARPRSQSGTKIGSCLNIPLTVENRIIGILSLFDEKHGTFDTNLLQLTTMIADYAAVALENVRLHERENALWHEAELERARLELIIGSMAEGLLITDERGVITSLNNSAQQLLATTLNYISPGIPLQKIAETSRVIWLPRLAGIIQQALNGNTIKNEEIVAGNDDEVVPLTLTISAAPLYDSSGLSRRTVGVVAVLNDITSNKQVERLKDEFISIVSHELRTPLTAIKGYTQHLIRRIEKRLRIIRNKHDDQHPLPTTDIPEFYDLRNLNIIESQTEHLERLVSDLLDLSQVQWGKLYLHYDRFYLADMLSDMVRSIQASTEQHAIILEIKATETQVQADRARIEQVVGNILDNAVKYSPHGGQISVYLQKQSTNYLISVRDQGIGISSEQFDHIFERFYRVHNTASQPYSGIGLGLYVAKAIVEAHGGEIWLDNPQGNGSTFHFTLPDSPARTHPLPEIPKTKPLDHNEE